ncbi:unnamed protein product [Bursaphelenchus xylophilus]|uniref:(pine wood nematode) hypothetical protein n=1 Tax=Bursaphelenchus xylophilus TaxID=6326 RepID=A0A1I7SLA6_BURXY|nr:unnamed protein product [Bursaphelenchus xylophilus]CAG9129448.1 unnamed protein product [Bursaphelenchus xylophilus]
MSKTFAILKPDLVSCPPLALQALRQILSSKLRITRMALIEKADKSRLRQLYKEHEGRFYHNRLIRTMGSGPVLLMEMGVKESSSTVDPISEWRSMLGPSKLLKGYPEPESSSTLRWKYALSDVRNSAHGADSEASARRELAIFEDQLVPFDEKKLLEMLSLQNVEGSEDEDEGAENEV